MHRTGDDREVETRGNENEENQIGQEHPGERVELEDEG